MLRSLALALFIFPAAPAFAGCWEAEETSITPDTPKVAICYQRGCSEGFVVRECGNATSVLNEYSNGWKFFGSETETYATSPEGEIVRDFSLIRCYDEPGEYLCPTLHPE